MAFTSWLQRLKGNLGRVQRHRPQRRDGAARRFFPPRLEALEDRTLPSTFTVLNLNDSGPNSLRAAVASGDDTIAFAKGLHGTIKLTSGELLIGNSVTIDGPGADRLSVSGNYASRVFEIDAGLNVTISGLTITNGFAPDQGGGILNDGSNLTLSGDDLTQNVALESAAANGALGGGLASQDGALTITGCLITGNQASVGRRRALAETVGEAFGGGIVGIGEAVPRSVIAHSAPTLPSAAMAGPGFLPE